MVSLLMESVSAMVAVDAVIKDAVPLSEFGTKYVHGSNGSDVVSDVGENVDGGIRGDDAALIDPLCGISGAIGGIGKRRMGGDLTCRNVVLK